MISDDPRWGSKGVTTLQHQDQRGHKMAMAEPADDRVIEVVDYLRETIADIDETVRSWHLKRTKLAVRLAALEAATDGSVLEAAADYERRLGEDRPYEAAEDVADLVKEAHSRFVT
ncbi:MAG: hypothetical protein M3Q48_15345 [Actinomycetota bacterium]|nr:hypothetical protein [Actinomycetota bacterium]